MRWDSGLQILLLLFAAVTLGGLGTAFGALIGSLVIGLVVEVSPVVGVPGDFKYATALLILILLLMVRPQGSARQAAAGRLRKGTGTWTTHPVDISQRHAARGDLAADRRRLAIAVIGLNIHFGFTGLLNIGQAGFMLLGAYGFAISVWNGLPFARRHPVRLRGGVGLRAGARRAHAEAAR